MTTNIIDTNSLASISANDSNGLWVVTEDTYVATTGVSIYTPTAAGIRKFQIFGHVSSEDSTGLRAYGQMELLVGADATLTGGSRGVSFSPAGGATDADAYIVNQGTISGGAGIVTNARSLKIENEGAIFGVSKAAIANHGMHTEIRNHGILDGYTDAVHATGDLLLINEGSIHSQNHAISVNGTAVIENQGSIFGTVKLGSGHDRFNSLGGTIHGGVYLGAGSDQFSGSGKDSRFTVDGGNGDDWYDMVDKEYAIIERERQGFDTVAINASYRLKTWVEGLMLTGNGNFDATGNEARNDLMGNAGDNEIRGMEGNDFLEGLGGDDLLNGGSGRDMATFWGARGELVVNLMKGYAVSEASGRDRLVSIEDITSSNTNDILIGNDSANRLNPENGDSQLTGNGGRDTFVFSSMAMGDHIITDFVDGIDMIEIRTGQHAWHSYKDLSSHIRQQGSDVVIAADGYDGRVSIRLLDTDIKDITTADFVFS